MLTFKISDVFDVVKACAPFAAKKSTIAILGHFKFSAVNGKLAIAATDAEAQITALTWVDYDGPEFTLDADRFMKFLSSADDKESEVKITVDPSEKEAVIKCGKTRAKYACQDASLFPLLSVTGEQRFSAEIESTVLSDAIDFCLPAVAKKDPRTYLMGLYIAAQGEDVAHFVGTDGFRLALAPVALRSVRTADELGTGQPDCIVPRDVVAKVQKAFAIFGETVRIGAFTDDRAVISSGNVEIVTKLLVGKYPNYMRVISEHSNAAVSFAIDRAAFSDALKQVSAIDAASPQVLLSCEDQTIRFKQTNELHDQAEDAIDVSYQGASFEIMFNTDYLVDAVTSLKSDSVQVMFRNTRSAMFVCPESGYKHVVMALSR